MKCKQHLKLSAIDEVRSTEQYTCERKMNACKSEQLAHNAQSLADSDTYRPRQT